MVTEVKMSAFSKGDIVWAYTTYPEKSSPYMKPERVELLGSFEWDGDTLWDAKLLDSKFGSQQQYGEFQLAREPVRPEPEVVE